ncbi:helix-turn-helix transcriptional regulator [Oculatella sp. FACHB-28]|uniref:helix-turn-helix domain-containing protein n=1 Tax=Cyanophyceae TaxID=3028117 RepID=UPI001687FC42|nr:MULTISPECIES: AraC family transcriptional regulator [Cyanophyceae]MBD1997583.1 helix-turn-helix transcriptional regulator [Leptolyngbya sp. FACHB-541]MBD2060644.1 helix-turn-helix transcriptional regulator [Oculatella sp. FACHB-28]
MSQEQLLQVNFTEEDAATSLLPRLPLLSSHNLGWAGLWVQHHYQPAWEMPEYAPSQHMLSIHHLDHAAESERVLDGKKQREQLNKGDIALIPANVLHKKLWRRDCDFTLLMLDPDHVAHIAHETVDADRVEILPHFAKSDPLIYQIGVALTSELASEQPSTRLYIDSLTTALAAHLIRHYSTTQPKIPTIADGLSNYALEKAIDYIHAYLDQEITLPKLAEVVGMSQYYFCRLFKQSTGISPHQYLLQQRVERAKQLLQQRKFSIADIALQCGFSNQSHLNRHFKRIVGVTPFTFLKQ